MVQMIQHFLGMDFGLIIIGLYCAHGMSMYAVTWWAYAGSSLWLENVGIGAQPTVQLAEPEFQMVCQGALGGQ